MPKCPAKLQPWQVFHAAIKTLSAGVIASIFGKANIRTVYLYGQNPAHTEQRCKNPLEAMHMMFAEMDARGRGDVAHCAIDYLRTALEDVAGLEAVKELKATICEEILEDYIAVGRMQAAIQNGEPIEVIEREYKEALAEIDRTFAKVWQERGK